MSTDRHAFMYFGSTDGRPILVNLDHVLFIEESTTGSALHLTGAPAVFVYAFHDQS